MSCKHWCFTLNNYNTEELKALESLATTAAVLQYLVIGKEVGEDNGTPHLQGYVVFKNKKRLTTVKKLIGSRAHVEPKSKWSTPAEASNYCKKDGDYQEFGECPGGSGTRSDLVELYTRIQDGASGSDIGQSYPSAYIRYGRRIDELIRRRGDRPRDRATGIEVYALCGRTGVGKTRFVWDRFGSDLYVHGGNPRFFDGYIGQRYALFDDYDGSVFKLSRFLRILDRYPLNVEVKGGFINWRPDIIFITSNKPVIEWYANAYQEHIDALNRRITQEWWIEESLEEILRFFQDQTHEQPGDSLEGQVD